MKNIDTYPAIFTLSHENSLGKLKPLMIKIGKTSENMYGKTQIEFVT